MLGNAVIGGAVGCVGGYFLGPLPPTVWTTGAGPWMLALLSAIAANSAANEYQSGFGDLAAINSVFAISPLTLTSSQLVLRLDWKFEKGPFIIESEGAAVLNDGAVSASASNPRAYSTAIRADIAESSAYNTAITTEQEVGLQRPGGSNVGGPDFITARFNRLTRLWEIVVTDVKASSSAVFGKPATVVEPDWMPEIQAAVARLKLQNSQLEQAIREAFAAGRIVPRQLNVNNSPSPSGQGVITGW